jgi:hypothetical protein
MSFLLIGAERFIAEFVPVRRRAPNNHGFHTRNMDRIVDDATASWNFTKRSPKIVKRGEFDAIAGNLMAQSGYCFRSSDRAVGNIPQFAPTQQESFG